MANLEDLFDSLDSMDRDKKTRQSLNLIKAPLPWPGGKTGIAQKIVEYLPLGTRYIEPFGGSAAVLFARQPVALEVYNDKYGAIVEFYRTIRNKEKMEQLADRLYLTVYSREEWQWCKDTWDQVQDDVERAARWFYMLNYSFGGLGRNWGRAVGITGSMAGKVRNKIKDFPIIQNRLKNVQLENMDWHYMFEDYDHPDSVFYCDPPYLEVSAGIYKAGQMSPDQHGEFLDTVFATKGFVAVSSYENQLYQSYPWDETVEWEKYVSIQSLNTADGSGKKNQKDVEKRGHRKEILYIKEAS